MKRFRRLQQSKEESQIEIMINAGIVRATAAAHDPIAPHAADPKPGSVALCFIIATPVPEAIARL